jgi:CRP-like cAMP-binding protein
LSETSPLLKALPEAGRAVSRLLDVVQSGRLFNRGDRPSAMYFVLSGEVRLVRQSQAGGEIVLQRTRRGFLAEASLDQKAYHCDAVAAAPSEVLAIPRRAFADALAVESFRTGWIGHLARELRRVRAQAERLSLKTARERISHFIETEGDDGIVILTQSKKDWAAELGLTHEALYRALSQLQRDGVLDVTGPRLRLM